MTKSEREAARDWQKPDIIILEENPNLTPEDIARLDEIVPRLKSGRVAHGRIEGKNPYSALK